MIEQTPFFVVGIPLFTALIIGLVGVFYPKLVRWIGLIGISLATVSSIVLFKTVEAMGRIQYFFGNWPAPVGIEYAVDHLNALMILLIYAISFFAFIYSMKSVSIEISQSKQPFYYTLYFLLITGLVGITMTGDAFNLYVLYEICALSSYSLLALGGRKAYLATFYYLLIGSVGACFYLLGVGYLFIKTGTLNISHLMQLLPPIYFAKSILIAFIFVNVGLFIKMALFPVHGWMTNIYSKAPISTLCLLAPLGTKLTIYVLLRFYLDVFSPEYVYQILSIQNVMVWLATIAIIVGSLYAIIHTNYRKIITYIVVAEIGYIVGGIWIGTMDSLVGAIYHIVADALMTMSLFMIGGMVLFYLKSDALNDVSKVFRQLPITAVSLVVVFLSIVGVPPTSGFFSKLYLIKGAFQMGQYHFIVALLFSSLVSLFLFFRYFEAYFFDSSPDQKPLQRIKESPVLAIPLVSVSLGIILLGVTFSYWYQFILNIIPVGFK